MTKKKQEKQPEMVEKRLSPAQYWEWRTTIEELKTAELRAEVARLKRDLMEKDLECKKLRLMLYKDVLKKTTTDSQKAKAEYDRFKGELEKELDMSLDGCAISEETFVVTKLD